MPAIDTLIIDSVPGETRVCAIKRDRLYGFTLDRPEQRSRIDQIFCARVLTVDDRLAAAFVDLGNGSSGYLPVKDIVHGKVREGDGFILQVTRDAAEDKSVKVTTRVTVGGFYLVLTAHSPGLRFSRKINKTDRARLQHSLEPAISPQHGCIVRSNAQSATPEAIAGEYQGLLSRWQQFKDTCKTASAPKLLFVPPVPAMAQVRDYFSPDLKRIVCNDAGQLNDIRQMIAAFDSPHQPELILSGMASDGVDRDALNDQIDSIMSDHVTLPSGGSVIFSETPALVAIDVNSASDNRGPRATNLEAAAEIARQTRLRHLGGQIIIDFITMKKAKDRDDVETALKKAFRPDPLKTFFAGFSNLGLYEMTRKRAGKSIHELLSTDRAEIPFSMRTKAINALRDVLINARARPGAPYRIDAGDDVIDALQNRLKPLLQETEALLGAPLLWPGKDTLTAKDKDHE